MQVWICRRDNWLLVATQAPSSQAVQSNDKTLKLYFYKTAYCWHSTISSREPLQYVAWLYFPPICCLVVAARGMSAVEQINPCRQTNSSQILDKYWDGNTVQTLVIVVNLSDESLAVRQHHCHNHNHHSHWPVRLSDVCHWWQFLQVSTRIYPCPVTSFFDEGLMHVCAFGSLAKEVIYGKPSRWASVFCWVGGGGARPGWPNRNKVWHYLWKTTQCPMYVCLFRKYYIFVHICRSLASWIAL